MIPPSPSMANFSHAAEHSFLQSVSPLATFLKLTSLGFIIGVGVVGNLLISVLLVKDRSLHRTPYYFLLDLCASDILRSAVCFPFVFSSVKNGSAWTYGALTCKVIAFLGVLSCFHTAFMLFCVSVTRYLAIAHHRFYTKRLTFWTCLAVICMVWTLSVAMAFPPVLDVGTYSFIREEDQCTFQHRSFRANDSLGFMLLLALILLATQLVYLKLIFFVHDRRKMKPVQFVPAVSQNWTFHGPGASGQAAANWLAGFGRGPTPPTLLGIRQNTNAAGRRRLLVLDEFKTEKRISRMFYAVTFFFLALWGPYLVACYWRVFTRGPVVPGGYLTAAVWMSFAQAGVNPFICIFSNRELRRCFSATLLYCRKSSCCRAFLKRTQLPAARRLYNKPARCPTYHTTASASWCLRRALERYDTAKCTGVRSCSCSSTWGENCVSLAGVSLHSLAPDNTSGGLLSTPGTVSFAGMLNL
ncbi:hypothetical protein COCON_G00230070 [Conger conger]|uniref:G-protein coupled receptors family 1 profile domain-containing protein n=3 Tax=Elopomorpha TaxID=32521 RepID=A0A9Q1CVB7_CONCO|nr:hypothetical protein COCON_G00230070 [Conger conger]